MRTKVIDIGIYKTNLTIFLGGRYADISVWLKENISDDEEECRVLTEQFYGTFYENNANGAFAFYKRDFFVWVRHANSVSELVHELYHATNYILTQCGVAHDEIDEPYAYLLEYLTREALKK